MGCVKFSTCAAEEKVKTSGWAPRRQHRKPATREAACVMSINVGAESQDLVFRSGRPLPVYNISSYLLHGAYHMEPFFVFPLELSSNTALPASSLVLSRNASQQWPTSTFNADSSASHPMQRASSRERSFVHRPFHSRRWHPVPRNRCFPFTPCASNTHAAREGDEQENTFCDFIK